MESFHRDPDEFYEIIDGVEVEMPPRTVECSCLACDLGLAIALYTRPQKIGSVYFNSLVDLKLIDGRQRIRRPEFIFISEEKFPSNHPSPKTIAWEITPDICTEIVSPFELASDIETRIEEYFEAGIPQVWVVHPEPQKIYIYESLSNVKVLWRKDTLSNVELLPGFELPLHRVFRKDSNPEEK